MKADLQYEFKRDTTAAKKAVRAWSPFIFIHLPIVYIKTSNANRQLLNMHVSACVRNKDSGLSVESKMKIYKNNVNCFLTNVTNEIILSLHSMNRRVLVLELQASRNRV